MVMKFSLSNYSETSYGMPVIYPHLSFAIHRSGYDLISPSGKVLSNDYPSIEIETPNVAMYSTALKGGLRISDVYVSPGLLGFARGGLSYTAVSGSFNQLFKRSSGQQVTLHCL